MASIKQTPSGAFQLCVKNKLLPKTLWATFDTRDAAEQYGAQLEGLLKQGIVPSSLLEREPPKPQNWTIGRCIAEYQKHNAVPESDVKLLDTVRPKLALLATGALNYDWAESWVVSMKRVDHLAPSTIRHRHGALARCFDWMTRKHPEIMAQNPLRLLKRGFSTYTPEDTALLAQDGKQPRFDIERDRRLEEGEEAAILKMFEEGSEERLFFILALETAMRMRECYTLYVDQVNLQKRTIHLERSKNGETRQVPLSSVAREVLDSFIREHQAEIAARDGRLFSFWNGDLAIRNLDRTTADVSRRFRIAFTDAGVQGLTFHDLRHEATCRLFERTTLSVVVNKDVASSHAAFLNCSGGFRSGFSQTSSFNSQSRVAPLQRSGWRCFAAS